MDFNKNLTKFFYDSRFLRTKFDGKKDTAQNPLVTQPLT